LLKKKNPNRVFSLDRKTFFPQSLHLKKKFHIGASRVHTMINFSIE
jgi:hypothetical protein